MFYRERLFSKFEFFPNPGGVFTSGFFRFGVSGLLFSMREPKAILRH
jgi:hypothetical protein